jgi:hypothetical protein
VGKHPYDAAKHRAKRLRERERAEQSAAATTAERKARMAALEGALIAKGIVKGRASRTVEDRLSALENAVARLVSQRNKE